jgi:hypothetical protein
MASETSRAHDDQADPPDPGTTTLFALHGEREEIERALVLAQQRQLYSPDAEDARRAEMDEQVLLADLDRVLTRIRAAEYRRQPNARAW